MWVWGLGVDGDLFDLALVWWVLARVVYLIGWSNISLCLFGFWIAICLGFLLACCLVCIGCGRLYDILFGLFIWLIILCFEVYVFDFAF